MKKQEGIYSIKPMITPDRIFIDPLAIFTTHIWALYSREVVEINHRKQLMTFKSVKQMILTNDPQMLLITHVLFSRT